MKNRTFKSAEELGITEGQKQNFIKLLRYIIVNRDKVVIDMTMFNDESLAADNHVRYGRHECGTAACLLGHAAIAGIKFDINDTWASYGVREFGCDALIHGDQVRSFKGRLYSLLFGGRHSDDTQNSINRLRYFLMNGIPKGMSISDLNVFEVPFEHFEFQ